MLQEGQRRVTNMNDCRDVWAKLMRTAADQQAQPLKGPTDSQARPGPQLDADSGTARNLDNPFSFAAGHLHYQSQL